MVNQITTPASYVEQQEVGYTPSSSVSGSCVEEFRSLQADPYLSKFLSPGFDTGQFLREAISADNTPKSYDNDLYKLSRGIRIVERELKNEVTTNHRELLGQVESLSELEETLEVIQSSVASLQTSSERLQQNLGDSYQQAKARLSQLSNMWETTEILRKLLRFVQLVGKLKEDLSTKTKKSPPPPPAAAATSARSGEAAAGDDSLGRGDLAKAATLLYECESLLKESNLKGIDIVDSEEQWLKQTGDKIRANSRELLINGVKALNQADIGSALQVFFNLNVLSDIVSSLVASITADVYESIRSALDIRHIASAASSGTAADPRRAAGATTTAPLTPELVREKFLNGVRKMFQELHAYYVQVWNLQRVLEKKRDPITQVCFIDVVQKEVAHGKSILQDSFWQSITEAVSSSFMTAMRDNQFIQNTFVDEYPQLLATFQSFLAKFDEYFTDMDPKIRTERNEQWLYSTLASIQQLYIERCIKRLSQKLGVLFGKIVVPSSSNDFGDGGQGGAAGNSAQVSMAEVRSLAASILQELARVKEDTRLSSLVARHIAKNILQVFYGKMESMIIDHNEAHIIRDDPNAFQRFNASLHNAIFVLHGMLTIALPTFAPVVANSLQPSLDSLSKLGSLILDPIFERIRRILARVIFRIHTEDFSRAGMQPSSGQYVTELEQRIAAIRRRFLAPLYDQNTPAFQASCKATAEYLVRYFIRQVSLVRHLSEAGKLRLAGDMAQVELAISGLYPVEKLGPLQKELSAFRSVIFMETDKIEQSVQVRAGIVDPIAVLHHLFSRAALQPSGPQQQQQQRGGPVLRSPHVQMNTTFEKYAEWLESSTPRQQAEVVLASVNYYENQLGGVVHDHQMATLISVMKSIAHRGIQQQQQQQQQQ